jgi:hypothetical protein
MIIGVDLLLVAVIHSVVVTELDACFVLIPYFLVSAGFCMAFLEVLEQ